ncbi:lysophospholipid acyltransferase family protein [Thioclava sp. GXIMD4216]|uniref:lysophospholipid acyltransferase family protein n=1 Tax=Thioclava sp. GXIMD4216 TaxID=3131929 RepID=UPI0030CC83F3
MNQMPQSELKGAGVTGQSSVLQRDRTAEDIRTDEGFQTVQKPYDKRRLSYAGTFSNPFKRLVIRLVEWATAKVQILRVIRQFEARGIPAGQAFWAQALEIMGVTVTTPAEEIARIPAKGPLVIVANHPHGLVDGMVLAEVIGRVRGDYKILTRNLLTGLPEIAQFMIPVPFAHEPNAREEGLKMRADAMLHLKRGGCIVLFPAGSVAASDSFFGPVVEKEWNPFTAKMVARSKAQVLPVRFPTHNSRLYQIANQLSATLRQSLLLYEIRAAFHKPQRPIIGHVKQPDEMAEALGNPRQWLADMREETLSLRG